MEGDLLGLDLSVLNIDFVSNQDNVIGGQLGTLAFKVVDDFDFEEPSTKSFQVVIEACGLKDQKVLFVTAENAPVLVKSSRNLPKVNATHLGSLGAYQLLRADAVLFTRKALDGIVEAYGQKN